MGMTALWKVYQKKKKKKKSIFDHLQQSALLGMTSRDAVVCEIQHTHTHADTTFNLFLLLNSPVPLGAGQKTAQRGEQSAVPWTLGSAERCENSSYLASSLLRLPFCASLQSQGPIMPHQYRSREEAPH